MFFREYHIYFTSTAEYLTFLTNASSVLPYSWNKYGIHEKKLNFLFITFF